MVHAPPLVLERLKALVPQRDRAATALAYVLAAACVGHAIQLQNGAYLTQVLRDRVF